jgi:hypothetical protein
MMEYSYHLFGGGGGESVVSKIRCDIENDVAQRLAHHHVTTRSQKFDTVKYC